MLRLAVLILALCVSPLLAGLTLYEDVNDFKAAAGPSLPGPLLFRTDKADTETFTPGTYKVRPGDWFSDLVTFSSPGTTLPDTVAWGHFDGDDGGVGSGANLLSPLRLDFADPATATGFRLRGVQPGTNVRYYGDGGVFLGEMVASASSFVGAISTDPISYLVVQENPPLPGPGQRQQPAYITSLYVAAVPEPSALLLAAAGTVIVSARRRVRP